MIPHGVEIYLGVEPIDLRWGFDRLCGIVQERIGRRPRSGALFKRLDAGTFKFPLSYDGESSTLVLSERELETLFSGIDIDLPTRH